MSLVELPVATGDGHRFTLRIAGPADARASLMFVPALGVPAAKYDGFATALAGRGVRVAVPEWRGLGSSSLRARRGVDWGYPELLSDLAAARAALPGGDWFHGGHSLGGQFAAMAAARDPGACRGLVLVATGVPHSQTFRGLERLAVSLFARSLPPLTRLAGYYPGQRLGFAGREAGGVMRDWAATVRSGRYLDYVGGGAMDDRLARLSLPVLGLRFARDWLVPLASLEALVAKLGPGPRRMEVFDDARLGAHADHFRWMKAPAAPAGVVAQWLLSP